MVPPLTCKKYVPAASPPKVVFNVPPPPIAQPRGMRLLQLVPEYNPTCGVFIPLIVILSIGAVRVNLYHTSAAGFVILPTGLQPCMAL